MFYKNARIFTSDFPFHHGAFEGTGGRFGAVLPEAVPEDAIDLGVSEHAATYNAACAIGAVTEVGMIAPGRLADFIICRSEYTAKRVFLGGVEV